MRLEKHQKIFGIGLSKTGTTSLGMALQNLGVRTIHNPIDQQTYNELTSANYDLSILKEYQAIVDIPVAPFYAQLDKIFPSSKFILTVRDKNSWIKSIKTHFEASHHWLEANPSLRDFVLFLRACVFGSLDFNEERFLYVYDFHVKNVKDYFKGREKDLLILDIIRGEGWEKLCPFLGLEIPVDPFPHLNVRGEDTTTWVSNLKQTYEDILDIVNPNEKFILVDDNKIGEVIYLNQKPFPFLEKDGNYWGPPSDDRTAMQELERLRKKGADLIVFTWISFWWLERYPRFYDYLRSHFKLTHHDDRLLIFDLRN